MQSMGKTKNDSQLRIAGYMAEKYIVLQVVNLQPKLVYVYKFPAVSIS
jgi:hypothetical protein